MPERREAILLAYIAFVGILDTSVMIPTIAAYARSLGASEVMAGLVAGMYSYVALVISVAAGVIVDLIGRRRALILGLLWDAAAVALYSLARTPLQLAVLRGVHALGGSLVYPAAYARAAGGGEPNIPRLSIALAATALAVAIGITLGGIGAHVIGFRMLYIIVSIALLTGAIAALALPPRPREGYSGEGVRSIWEVLRGLRRAGLLVALGSYTILAAYIGLGVVTGGLATALLRDGLAGSEGHASRIAGEILGVLVIVSSLVIIALGRIYRPGRGMKVLATASIIGSIAIITYVGLGPTTIYIVLAIIGGGLALGSLILASTILVVSAPPESRGTAVGVQQVFNIVGAGVGAALGGFASAYAGVTGVVVLAGLAGIAASLGPIASLKAGVAR